MERVATNEDIDAELRRLTSEVIGPCTSQIFENKDNEMQPYASGVLAQLGGNYYILTASHVTEDWSDDHPLYLKIHGGYISIVGIVRETDIEKSDNIDLAYIKLEDAVVEELKKGNKFITIDKFTLHLKFLDTMQYCIFGYPVVNQKREEGVLKTSGMAYYVQGSKPIVLDYYKLNPKTHFALDFKGKGVDIKSGEKIKFKGVHYGLSGCGLWLIKMNKVDAVYKGDVRLIGIMTEFKRDKYDCLIGNHIDIILEAQKKFEGLKYKEIR
jgi:hypothetical protein